MTMTVEAPADVVAEVKPARKSRAKKAKEAPAVEAVEAPVSITAESVLPEEIQSILTNIEAAVEAGAVEGPEAAAPEKPAYDVDMGLFKGGANLFGKEENRAVMEAMAVEVGVEVKNTKNGNPYITVSRDQIDTAMKTAEAAGLSVGDARPREAANYAAKQQAKEALRFEGAGNLLIQASQRMFETGKTFVPGKELNVYQTKESVADQAAIAEARAAGKDVKDKPIEIGIFDKRTETVIVKGSVGRDEKGQVTVDVTLDQIAKANQRRPENLQLIIPTRETVIANLNKAVEQRAVKPVPKAKDAAEQGR